MLTNVPFLPRPEVPEDMGGQRALRVRPPRQFDDLRARITSGVVLNLYDHRRRHVLNHHVNLQFFFRDLSRRRGIIQQEAADAECPGIISSFRRRSFRRPAAVDRRGNTFDASLDLPRPRDPLF